MRRAISSDGSVRQRFRLKQFQSLCKVSEVSAIFARIPRPWMYIVCITVEHDDSFVDMP